MFEPFFDPYVCLSCLRFLLSGIIYGLTITLPWLKMPAACNSFSVFRISVICGTKYLPKMQNIFVAWGEIL